MVRLSIDVDKITENFKRISDICDRSDIQLVTVAKLCLTNLDIIKPIIDAGARIVAESNLVNLANLPYDVDRMLLRASLKDIEGGLENCDYLFLSDMVHLKALKGLPPEREVGVYLSVEAGDLREGALAGELSGLIRAAARFKGRTHIVGFAANYGCLRGFIPMKEEVAQFRSLCDDAAAAAGLATYTLSIGGTSIFDLLEDGSLKGLIDQVRIGEAIYFGYNMSLHRRIEGLHNDAFILTGEVMEVKEKLVSGEETRGFNAFGRKPESPWRGYRKRAILNFGELAAPTRSLFPLLQGAYFAGATHDYAVVDVTDCEEPPRSGDLVQFGMNYNSAAQAILSPYVEKDILWTQVGKREEKR